MHATALDRISRLLSTQSGWEESTARHRLVDALLGKIDPLKSSIAYFPASEEDGFILLRGIDGAYLNPKAPPFLLRMHNPRHADAGPCYRCEQRRSVLVEHELPEDGMLNVVEVVEFFKKQYSDDDRTVPYEASVLSITIGREDLANHIAGGDLPQCENGSASLHWYSVDSIPVGGRIYLFTGVGNERKLWLFQRMNRTRWEATVSLRTSWTFTAATDMPQMHVGDLLRGTLLYGEE